VREGERERKRERKSVKETVRKGNENACGIRVK
jgi:hypothetical protein